MTEEILQAAILRLKSQALERYAIIKDLYHRPTTPETVELITQHAVALAQLEGAMVTLQQYSPNLANQTVAEAESNLPEQQEEQPEEEVDEQIDEEPEESYISEKELAEKSRSFRDSQKYRKKKAKK
jgi:hypothetical protein